jgi:hypothetical protein
MPFLSGLPILSVIRSLVRAKIDSCTGYVAARDYPQLPRNGAASRHKVLRLSFRRFQLRNNLYCCWCVVVFVVVLVVVAFVVLVFICSISCIGGMVVVEDYC